MTTAQEEAFTKCEEIMREHFASAVLVVEGETDKDTQSEIRCTYHGGYAASVGLLRIGELNVWKNYKDSNA